MRRRIIFQSKATVHSSLHHRLPLWYFLWYQWRLWCTFFLNSGHEGSNYLNAKLFSAAAPNSAQTNLVNSRACCLLLQKHDSTHPAVLLSLFLHHVHHLPIKTNLLTTQKHCLQNHLPHSSMKDRAGSLWALTTASDTDHPLNHHLTL